MRSHVACRCALFVGLVVLFAETGDIWCSSAAGADEPQFIGKGYYDYDELVDNGHVYPAYWKPSEEMLKYARDHPKSDTADEALLEAALKLKRKEEYAEALQILDQVIANYGNSAYANLCSCWFRGAGLVTEQRHKAQRHVRDHPDFSADLALLRKAQLLERMGKPGEAVNLLEAYVEKFPDGRWADADVKLHYVIGRDGGTRRRWVRLYRTHEHVFWDLARLYQQRDRQQETIELLTHAIRAFPSSPLLPAYYDLLAKTYQQMGDTAKESAALEEFVRAESRLQMVGASYGAANLMLVPTRDKKEAQVRLKELGAERH